MIKINRKLTGEMLGSSLFITFSIFFLILNLLKEDAAYHTEFLYMQT